MESTSAQNAARDQALPLLAKSTNPIVAIVAAVASADPSWSDQPLLQRKPSKNPAQKAVRKTFKLTAYLSNLLPAGTVLVYQVLSPFLSHNGQCTEPLNRSLTLVLIVLSGISCFFLRFTDSVRDERGKVRYGIPTFSGLWVIDGSGVQLSEEDRDRYRIKLLDFVHASLSTAIFSVIVAFDPNFRKCYIPSPSEEERRLLVAVPAAVGIGCSIFFLAFPSKRHGVGFPLSRH
ncbi:hypothetical protein MLD38_033330 [Melastoma candidum]|uniref:Uncharacterized protein n=1 Tax=Melastoma candidum TaxID=119954 RepID=A0ACB9M7Q7_9MYRT|nr:hypothetical protein MLD38_033330 [Melastoma candidum]